MRLALIGIGLGMLPALGAADGSCAGVSLEVQLLRRPAVYAIGEHIPARLIFKSAVRREWTLAGAPEAHRARDPLEEEIVVEPHGGTSDPASRDRRIHVGSILSTVWRGSKPLVREIDLTEWVSFEKPGRYGLHFISRRVSGPAGPKFEPCKLVSNSASVEIVAAGGEKQLH